jgi:hypothetical protein
VKDAKTPRGVIPTENQLEVAQTWDFLQNRCFLSLFLPKNEKKWQKYVVTTIVFGNKKL